MSFCGKFSRAMVALKVKKEFILDYYEVNMYPVVKTRQ